MTRALLGAGAALLAVLLHGCGSSPESGSASNNSALQRLDAGTCPNSIIDHRGRDASGAYRYGSATGTAATGSLRQRELDNCAAALARGDTAALQTLVAYYRGTGEQRALAATMATYIENGEDREALGRSATYLYQAYASGELGVPRDPALAFRFLGIAVNNGSDALRLLYAQELLQRGLYDDALRYLQAAAADSAPPEQQCDALLDLGYLYFGASERHENWNLGYYYWQSGLALAHSPRWGSCAEDNFVYGERYARETQRLKFVQARVEAMSSAQRQVIDQARDDPARGAGFVAQLSFVRPANAPSAPVAAANGSPPSSAAATLAGSTPRWRALTAPVCDLRGSATPLAWSDLFERNAGAIWTLDSRNGSSATQGSAVAVAPRQLITNCHLIKHPQNIQLLRVGQSLTARLLAADTAGDRCILSVERDLPVYVWASRSERLLKVGEDVAAIGNPKGLETSLSRGIVAQKRARDGLQLIQTDAAISSGSSGGGLFDRAGNLVGITTFTISEGQSLNFAIAIDEFCR
ncbi:hypothetical protein E4634_17745 [Mangrovimicrobium sediminis]|uniref:Trypsin-like serine protease n=1 Tax=Mangrovimicrobium sediminis TaxID=2562682 RepID=A0A4Z0LWE3_9GAMM|nr:trypsin-like peptidase domain-containing protein [Haliea sp. SAOS-164]TGD71497.1 hypothetical protein E4634_17745 [Haliea sp. SAOS-164]